MPNPYDDLLSDDQEEQPKPKVEPQPSETPLDPLNDPRFQQTGPEPLQAILYQINAFNKEGEAFSRLLSDLRVVDHEVASTAKKLFFVTKDPHVRGSLAGEKQYHQLQEKKFLMIIEPMLTLAKMHLEIVKRYNLDIDEHYFSVEKEEREVASDKVIAMDGINLQRKILGEATDSLQILAAGLKDTERRIKEYVNVGGKNNISQSEYELIVRKRETLTSGREHQFDYTIFDVNLLDKTALSLGIFVKETSAQYLKKLGKALNL